MHKKFYLAGLIAGLIAFMPQVQAEAAGKCDPLAQAGILAEARKKNDGSSAAIKAELQVRKTALRETIECASNEVETLRASVKALDPRDKEMATVRDRFVGRLTDALDVYALTVKKIDDMGVKGTKDAAKNLLEWRSGTYGPMADEAGNLVIWTKNQPLFDTAHDRLDKIAQTLRTLKLLELDDVKSRYEKSEANLAKALELNDRAKGALVEDLPAELTTPRIKDSLEALSATYKSFFELSEEAKKLLPI